MIHIEQAEATVFNVLVLKLSTKNIMTSMTRIWKIGSGLSGSWWNVLIVFTILSKIMRKLLAFFACKPMMSEQKVGLVQLRFCLNISEKVMAMKEFAC